MSARLYFLTSLLFTTAVSYCQRSKTAIKAPPGTVRVNDTLFVDKAEVNNVGWREYLFYLEKYDSAKLEQALPDTSVWRDTTISNDGMAEYYLRHPGFNNYPMVGISYEQAVAFCQWRSDRVNELNLMKPENERPFKKITYRLLTQKEWETIAAGKLSTIRYPYGYDSTFKKWRKKYYKAFNCKFPGDTISYNHGERSEYFSTVDSYFPNTSHTYCMIGNVSEMVSEKGIAKGGSFNHKLEDCRIVNNQYYTKPEVWLGFRCVAVVVK